MKRKYSPGRLFSFSLAVLCSKERMFANCPKLIILFTQDMISKIQDNSSAILQ
jgi:hypothetical protein